MQHFHDLTEINLDQSLVTIGSFDGVHLGHQQIIKALINRSKKLGFPAVVITFHPHPQLVIKNEIRPYYLTLPEQRALLLGEQGIDYVLTHSFDKKTSRLSAEEFVISLHDRLHFRELWVGYDFALGRDREGTPGYLSELGRKHGFSITEIPAFHYQGELVSSSLIRKKVRAGDVKAASRLLGRPFQVIGSVVRGENRGKSLGFATSNLDVDPEMVDIKPGVYACRAETRGEVFSAVTNIGFRPTFGKDLESPRLEAHLLDFSRDLYGENLKLSFIDRLRDEMKFDQISQLIDQIQADIGKARIILEG